MVDTAVGYAGGKTQHPTYKDVCSHRTGHAEVVRVEYDPSEVSYETLLDRFWHIHNPTTKNRQGLDFGSQYRSVIFFSDDDQKASALASKDAVNGSGEHRKKVVTEILPAPEFWRAEEYHQQYYEKNGVSACRF